MKKLWLILLIALVCTSAFATEKYPADLYSTHHGDDPTECKWDGIYTRIAHNYPTGTDAIDIEVEDGTCLPDGSTGEAIMLSVVDASNPYNVKEIFYDCTGRTGNTIENCERFYGQAVLEDDVVMLSFTGRMYEDIREALETSHRGSMESSFQLDMDNTGPRLKVGTGAILARNAADNAYVNIECADPSEANDATTKNWVETYVASAAYASGSLWDRSKQTLIDVSGTTLKVLPPDIFDDANGDTMPPLRPDGTSGYNANAADPYIDFTLADGKIDGAPASAPFAADLVSTGGETMLMLQRKPDGSYQLKKGDERITSTIITWTTGSPVGPAVNANTKCRVFGKRKTNVLPVAAVITAINNVRAYANAGNTYRIRPLILSGANEPPLEADIVYTGDWVNVTGTGAAQLVNLPVADYAVAAGATVRFAAECETLGDYGLAQLFYVGAIKTSMTDTGKWTTTAEDSAYKSDNNGVIYSLSSTYEFTADVSFATDTTTTRPDADSGAETVALIGSATYPYKQGATTTLVLRKYSEVSADTYASNPTSVQCPVCMVPPDVIGD